MYINYRRNSRGKYSILTLEYNPIHWDGVFGYRATSSPNECIMLVPGTDEGAPAGPPAVALPLPAPVNRQPEPFHHSPEYDGYDIYQLTRDNPKDNPDAPWYLDLYRGTECLHTEGPYRSREAAESEADWLDRGA